MFGLDPFTETLIVLVLVFVVTFYWARGGPKNLPPGPRGWPLIGMMPSAVKAKYIFKLFTGWAETYGGVMSVKFGRKLLVIVTDMDFIKEALVKKADAFADRDVIAAVEMMDTANGSLALENGPAWKERRRFALGSLRSFGMGKKNIEPSINEESRYLLEVISSKGDQPFDPTHLVNNAVANIFCKICFGDRFEYTDPRFARLIKHVRETSQESGTGGLLGFFPRLIYTPFFSHLLDKLKERTEFINTIVQEHRSTYDKTDMRDMIDMHISFVDERKDQDLGDQIRKDAFDDPALCRTIEIMFIAGSDTTTTTILWYLAYMALYPDVQKKVQAEIDEVVGTSRQPLPSTDSPSMPYTNATIYESQRIRTIIPLGIPYRTTQDTSLNGYHIPKHTGIIMNLWGVHHSPKYWDNPDRFDPTRFLSADGKTAIRSEHFIPFGIGRRICLGENLAKSELFIFIVNLLQQFSFSFPKDKPIPSLEGVSGFVYGPGPYEICATRRK